MYRHVIAHGNDLSGFIEDSAGVVAPLLDIRGE
jgi:hypothetical protein